MRTDRPSLAYHAAVMAIATLAAPALASEQAVLVYAREALLVPGESPAKGVRISIVGERIVAVATGLPAPDERAIAGRTYIDLSCCTVMPGFIDTQTHLSTERSLPPSRERLLSWSDAKATLYATIFARRTLDAGFTTVRDMGHRGRSMFAVRDAIQKGLIEGPRMQVAGELIGPTGGDLRAPFNPDVEPLFRLSATCDGAADCRRAVRAEVQHGADTIKVSTTADLTPHSPAQLEADELVEIRATAHRLGRKVTASAFSTDSINAALRAGFDAIVHATFMDSESFALLKQTGAYMIPTIAAARTVRDIANDPGAQVSPAWRAENIAIHDGMVASFQRGVAGGAKIAFGTDAGWRPHGRNAEQMVEMVELGMSPAAVLKSATVNAADAMGLADQVGSLRPGYFADLVAMQASPLGDIRQVLQPVMVVKGGRVVRDARPSAGVSGTTLIHAGSLYREAGGPIVRAQTIIVRGRLITDIRDGFVAPADIGEVGARVVDLKSGFIMPGFIDTHVHLTTERATSGTTAAATLSDADLAIVAAANAGRILRAGFTTVMDMGNGQRNDEHAIFATRDLIASGHLPGPEIRYAGSPLSITGFSRAGRLRDEVEAVMGPGGICDGPDACRRMVREQAAKGADFINVYTTGSLLSDPSAGQTFRDAELVAIADEAKALGKVLVSDGGNNPTDASGVNAAIRAGFGIIDTVTWPDGKTFRLLKQAGGYFAPHVHALQASVGDSPDRLSEGSMGWLPRPVLKKLFALKQQPASAIIGHRAGATLILASDSGVFPHGDNGREILAYLKLGIPMQDALAAATINAARAHRIDARTGSIAIGKEADIVGFEASPFEQPQTLLAPRFVMQDGRVAVAP